MNTINDNSNAITVAQRAQSIAVDPSVSAWVSASAGSGKTTVLTNRVLALMLAGREEVSAPKLIEVGLRVIARHSFHNFFDANHLSS